MSREDTLRVFQRYVADKLGVPPAHVKVGWDQKLDKPKVSARLTLEMMQWPREKREAFVRDIVAHTPVDLSALRERPSDADLKAQLRALRERKENH